MSHVIAGLLRQSPTSLALGLFELVREQVGSSQLDEQSHIVRCIAKTLVKLEESQVMAPGGVEVLRLLKEKLDVLLLW